MKTLPKTITVAGLALKRDRTGVYRRDKQGFDVYLETYADDISETLVYVDDAVVFGSGHVLHSLAVRRLAAFLRRMRRALAKVTP